MEPVRLLLRTLTAALKAANFGIPLGVRKILVDRFRNCQRVTRLSAGRAFGAASGCRLCDAALEDAFGGESDSRSETHTTGELRLHTGGPSKRHRSTAEAACLHQKIEV